MNCLHTSFIRIYSSHLCKLPSAIWTSVQVGAIVVRKYDTFKHCGALVATDNVLPPKGEAFSLRLFVLLWLCVTVNKRSLHTPPSLSLKSIKNDSTAQKLKEALTVPYGRSLPSPVFSGDHVCQEFLHIIWSRGEGSSHIFHPLSWSDWVSARVGEWKHEREKGGWGLGWDGGESQMQSRRERGGAWSNIIVLWEAEGDIAL